MSCQMLPFPHLYAAAAFLLGRALRHATCGTCARKQARAVLTSCGQDMRGHASKLWQQNLGEWRSSPSLFQSASSVHSPNFLSRWTTQLYKCIQSVPFQSRVSRDHHRLFVDAIGLARFLGIIGKVPLSIPEIHLHSIVCRG